MFRKEMGQDTSDHDQNLGMPVQAQTPVTLSSTSSTSRMGFGVDLILTAA